jgi:hypothetical protein
MSISSIVCNEAKIVFNQKDSLLLRKLAEKFAEIAHQLVQKG